MRVKTGAYDYHGLLVKNNLIRAIARTLIIGSESGSTSWRVRNKGKILKSFCPITTRALTRILCSVD